MDNQNMGSVLLLSALFILTLPFAACDGDKQQTDNDSDVDRETGVTDDDDAADDDDDTATDDDDAADDDDDDTATDDDDAADDDDDDTATDDDDDTADDDDDTADDDDDDNIITVDCSAISNMENWALCKATETTCEAVFYDSSGCSVVCAAAGLKCVESYEDIDKECAADMQRSKLNCAETGHKSDYCVCSSENCKPECAGKECGDDGCGGSCGVCMGFPNSACDETSFKCGCVPFTCATSPKQCGTGHDDGCGGTFNCPLNCPNGEPCVNGVCEGPRCEKDDCPAFPGAEGEGMYALGGRGGDVCAVTNTNDSGGGSLRDCVSGSGGPRTVIFRTGGIITLNSPLKISRSKLTIAGQTAPGDGITIRGYQVELNGDHTIIQHLRFRPGDVKKKSCPSGTSGFTEDALTINASNVIVDHVSASWGIDENLSAGTSAWKKATVQNSIISEGLYQTGLWHGECNKDYNPGASKGHSMGGLFKPKSGDMTISIHRNLWAHNNNRNPAVGSYETSQNFLADIRNNVIYNCPSMGYTSGASKSGKVNYIGNYAIWGPNTSDKTPFDSNADNKVSLYQSDNLIDTNKNGKFDGVNNGWNMFGGTYTKASSPFAANPVTTESPSKAIESVLAKAGARPWNRDSVDNRIIESVRKGTGKIINSQSEVGGWGTISPGTPPVDSDGDGMPDDWERAYGTDPNKADNNGDINGNGYTNLEEYLHYEARLNR